MASPNHTSIDEPTNEVTIKELVLKAIEWWKYLWRKKFIIIVVGLLGGGCGLIMASLSKFMYNGRMTFVLEENKSSPIGAYLGLANQLGLDLGGQGSSGVFEGDNIMEFLKSRLMLEKTLLSTIKTAGGKEQTLAEYYIDINQLRDQWKKFPTLQTSLHYPVGADRSKFTREQDSILNMIQSTMAKSNLIVEKPNKKLSFIAVQCISPDEPFAKVFTERLVAEATSFYIETKTKRTKGNVDRLQAQADSMEIQLNRKTYAVAATQDMNLNPARQMSSVKTEMAMRDKIVLQTMYGEIVKNLEMSKIAMAQETPVFQIVDRPILPLEKKKLGKLKGIVIGGILGGFLCIAVLLLRKIFRDLMA